jgi:Lrp/AsnC family leucine-responsive transcriptional regulator
MDKTDIKILAAMEKNARVSLKNLANDLNVKTSTIYHRLHKLRENNILERFTIAVKPESIGLTVHCLIPVRLKPMIIGKVDSMFLDSFAKYLSDQFYEVLFCSVGDDNQIWIIATFRDKAHFQEFKAKLVENPYIDAFQCIFFNKILKGNKLFSFIVEMLGEQNEAEYFDDSKENQSPSEDEEEEETDEEEVFF